MATWNLEEFMENYARVLKKAYEDLPKEHKEKVALKDGRLVTVWEKQQAELGVKMFAELLGLVCPHCGKPLDWGLLSLAKNTKQQRRRLMRG